MSNTSVNIKTLVLIPSYNPGAVVVTTVLSALKFCHEVWVVIDGSDDDSPQLLHSLQKSHDTLKIITQMPNQGKGKAVLTGIIEANRQGFTHVLTMDSDGQHPANLIPQFIDMAKKNPNALILGKPVFDNEAPAIRIHGRKISNFFVNLETLWGGIGDSLYGFRVYPIPPLIKIMQAQKFMRRFDFDIEAVVRLYWAGYQPINISAPVKYPDKNKGGVSHFHYIRDNLLLTNMHIRLLAAAVIRLPLLINRRFLTR